MGFLRRHVSRHMGVLVPTQRLLKSRRSILTGAVALAASALRSPAQAQATPREPDPQWYRAALKMKQLAQSWGDQPYGAVLVLGGMLIGQGPSRVVINQNADAHAEREAILDAQRRLGRQGLSGAVLYSTSRPCALCESAAAHAGVIRMYFGPSLTDAGVPGLAK